MKTQEELNALKREVESIKAKLAELTDDEMKQVTGGAWLDDDGSSYAETEMKCTNPECGYTVRWGGIFIGKTFVCPRCHQMTFTGV